MYQELLNEELNETKSKNKLANLDREISVMLKDYDPVKKKRDDYNFYGPEAEKKFTELTGKKFEDYYKTFHPKLKWLLFKICHDMDEATDVCTDAFVKSLSKLDQYNPEYRFSTWLFTIARRIMIERMNVKSLSVAIDDEREDGLSIIDVIPDNVNVELETADIIYEKANIVKNNIGKLNTKYRKVLEMRELKGMSYLDIAKSTDSNLSTVKSQIRNARIALKDNVKEDFKKIEELDFQLY